MGRGTRSFLMRLPDQRIQTSSNGKIAVARKLGDSFRRQWSVGILAATQFYSTGILHAFIPPTRLEGDQANSLYAGNFGSAGDINHDGTGDLFVTQASWTNSTGQKVGRVLFYFGNRLGVDARPSFQLCGHQPGQDFGRGAANVGDVNGDGFEDFAVSSPEMSGLHSQEGLVEIFYGSKEGLTEVPAWSFYGGSKWVQLHNIFPAGDMNGDGYADFFLGSIFPDESLPGEGRIWLFHGGPEGPAKIPAWTYAGDHAGQYCGCWVDVGGDLNGDGIKDLVVCSSSARVRGEGQGRVDVFYGSAKGFGAKPDWSGTWEGADHNLQMFGNIAVANGDVNGDGIADLVVGAYYAERNFQNEGAVAVWHGRRSALPQNPDSVRIGGSEWLIFGSSMSALNDINGDGIDDVLITARYAHPHFRKEGVCGIFLGSKKGLATEPCWSANGGEKEAEFGYAARTVGDLNGDGWPDFAVSAPIHRTAKGIVSELRVFYGPLSNLPPSTGWKITTPLPLLAWTKATAHPYWLAGIVSGLSVVAGGAFYRLWQRSQLLGSPAVQSALTQERIRIARDIHDELGARMSEIALLCKNGIEPGLNSSVSDERVQKISEAARRSVNAINHLIWQLNSEKQSLEEMTSDICEFAEQFLASASLSLRLELPTELPETTVPAKVRHHLFMAVREALNNAVRHSNATQIRISVTLEPSSYSITIVDDGCGFPQNEALQRIDSGSGLKNMSERMATIGGAFHFRSLPGEGTQLSLVVPI